MKQQLLGKVFVSHTAADKRFVRRLADRLTRERFQIWLDERDLVAGDALPERVSQALKDARVVLVIVSRASIASKWLKYELNLATERMIKGFCRVIPVVIDDAALPAEVAGLLYADCRRSLAAGWKSIETALKHEAHSAAAEHGFWAQAELLLEEVFGEKGVVSETSEYRQRDWQVVCLPATDVDGDAIEVPYDVVSNSYPPHPLNDRWWSEYVSGTADIGGALTLVVSERPIGFRLDQSASGESRVGVRTVKDTRAGITIRQVVVADLAGLADASAQKRVLHVARKTLIACAEARARERRRPPDLRGHGTRLTVRLGRATRS